MRNLHLSRIRALRPQVSSRGPAPPPARPRPSCRVPRTRVFQAQPSPPPPPVPRSHSARSPPAPSLLPTSLGPTLPSFVPGAPSRFPHQPRCGRREPPPRSCRSQPRAGAQLQPRQCLTTSTQKTTWTQDLSMYEKTVSYTWSIWPWMVSRVACRSQGLSDCFPKASLWSFA